MASLYQLGWRQGSVFAVSLEAGVAIDVDGNAETRAISHDRWIVATQDCDLDIADSGANDPRIELRPVYGRNGGPDCDRGAPDVWGVRSRKFRLNQDRDFVHADSIRLMASPALLNEHVGSRVSLLSDERRAAFTAWLGRRYDRPAVPEAFVPLARALSELARKARDPVRDHLHDVLMVFDEASSPTEIALFTITCNPDHSEECCGASCSDDHVADARRWMSGIAQELDSELGVIASIEAAPRAGTSMLIIESSYSADVSDITYGQDSVNGVG